MAISYYYLLFRVGVIINIVLLPLRDFSYSVDLNHIIQTFKKNKIILKYLFWYIEHVCKSLFSQLMTYVLA